MIDAIVAGDLFADLVMGGFAEWPRPGVEVIAENFHREVGGGAANSACGMAKLGSRVAVLGAIGRDGDWFRERLQNLGVETGFLAVDAEPTAVTVAITTARDRTFFTYPGANVRFPALLASFEDFGQARHVHVAYPTDLATIDRIKSAGCSVSLDVGWRETWLSDPRSLDVARAVDIFFPNQSEAERMTGETGCERIFEKIGARRVVLKRGELGAAMLWDGAISHAAPVRVNPVDTTGAGDCFNAGFLHFWLRGESPEFCLRAANVCGALSTEAYGGVNGFPDLERIRRELCVK